MKADRPAPGRGTLRVAAASLTLAACLGAWSLPVLARPGDDPARPASKAKAKAKVKGKADAKRKAAAPAAVDRAEARAIARDLAELAAAARAESGKGSKVDTSDPDWLARLGRPEKKVEAPTLTSADLDALIDSALAGEGVKPAPPATDEAFLRRASLDLVGKLPSPEDLAAFEANADPEKRDKVIDRLLASPEFAEHWARYWRDVFSYRATFMNPRLVNFNEFESWMAEQITENRPWDEIARDIITAEGPTAENGAGVFTAAHQGKPVEVAGEISRVFLGVQIQCAECHDHLTDPWKREQFHEFAAFFAGTTTRRDGKAGAVKGTIIATRPGKVRYAMPDLDDPQKQIPIEPRFFLASEVDVPKGLSAQDRRELVASFVASQDNPWFAKAFVNRAWYALMGEAFYDPIDDLGPARELNSPEVIDVLADAFAAGGYDVRWLFRTIAGTDAYRRQFRSSRSEAGQTPFAANCPSRLRADQILDGLGQALGFDPDAIGARGRAGKGNDPIARRFGARGAFNALFGVDPSTPNAEVLGTIPQALFFMNSTQVNNALRGRGGAVADVLAEHPIDDEAALETLYLRALARRPNAEEIAVAKRYLDEVPNRREAFEDLLWALINSAEFVSRR